MMPRPPESTPAADSTPLASRPGSSKLTTLNIAARVWASIGIFLAGFACIAALAHFQELNTESQLRLSSETLYPAALRCHEAEGAFREALQLFGAGSIAGEMGLVNAGAGRGMSAVDSLQAAARLAGLEPHRATRAAQLASQLGEFVAAARYTYTAGIGRSSANASPAIEAEGRSLAQRSTELQAALVALRGGTSMDVTEELASLRSRSTHLQQAFLFALCITLIVAGAVVSLTLHSNIVRPLARAEAELAQERDLLNALLDNIPDCIYFKGLDGRFLRINRALAALLGLDTPQAAAGRSDLEFFDSGTVASAQEDERRIVESGEPLIGKIERLAGNGPVRWMTTTKVPVRDESGKVRCLAGVSRDITAWKQAVESLERSEQSFRLLFSAIPHAVWVCDIHTLEILEVNCGAVKGYGYTAEEFRRMRLTDVYPAEESKRLVEKLAHEDAATAPAGAWKHKTKDGRSFDVEIEAYALEFDRRPCVLLFAQDVSERKRMELDLRQASRHEAAGQLAAGVAHEINTPIQYVGDNLRFIQDAFAARNRVIAQYEELRRAVEAGAVPAGLSARLQQAVEEADMDYLNQEIPNALAQSLDGVERVATIVRAMKEFSHPGRKEKAPADLNRSLRNAMIVARNEIKYVADEETDFGELPLVMCHIAELNQVFLNLLVNAADAIREVVKESQTKGRITVRTRCVGDQVVVSVSDTGSGVPEHIQSRIFDPFFTTKEVGRGTGQGLAIARSIVVDKHGGTIRFEPNGSQGTTFVISLPAGAAMSAGEGAAPAIDTHETAAV
jgi:two-component system, NtrC family, sensor kinase